MTGIPDKLYFRIGEVAKIVGVKAYVLRYWEKEFPQLAPSKSRSKQRLYRREEVELLLQIKNLLYDERFTINGARQRLEELKAEKKKPEQKNQDNLKPQISIPLLGQEGLQKNLITMKEKLFEAAKALDRI
ncbi:MAG: MerR family transcriptional regulator [Deltaproteobacteria bacterium]|nr:MerR family transcriptional regulator [Deltaproteobacteria bacterium]